MNTQTWEGITRSITARNTSISCSGVTSLPPQQANAQRTTFHDPCYLSRYNQRYQAPRSALQTIPQLKLNEIAQSKNRTFRCGAGGGSVWKGKKRDRELTTNG